MSNATLAMPSLIAYLGPMEPTATALQIRALPGHALNPRQEAFNRAAARLESLRNELAQLQALQQALHREAARVLMPAIRANAQAKLAFALHLEQVVIGASLSRAQQQQVAHCIRILANDAIEWGEGGSPADALMQRWPEPQPEPIQETDYESLDWEEELERRRQEAQHQREQARKAKGQKQAQATQQRSIRSIYVGLAKQLHPDLEPDPLLRSTKEEDMKRVTSAYAQGDLSTLLGIELTLLHQDNQHLATLPDHAIESYTRSLEAQADAIARELSALRLDELMAWTGTKEKDAIRRIRQEAAAWDDHAQHLRRAMTDIDDSREGIKRALAWVEALVGE